MSSRWQRFRHRRQLARMAGPRLLAAFADAYPEAVFVEIGANDGGATTTCASSSSTARGRG